MSDKWKDLQVEGMIRDLIHVARMNLRVDMSDYERELFNNHAEVITTALSTPADGGEQAVANEQKFILRAADLVTILDFIAPGRSEEELETEVAITYHRARYTEDGSYVNAGYWASFAEYPDGGALHISGDPSPAKSPDTPAGSSGEAVGTVVDHTRMAMGDEPGIIWNVGNVIRDLPVGTKLYTTPPAPLDVVGAYMAAANALQKLKIEPSAGCDYVHNGAIEDAVKELRALTPADAEAELEALMMKVADAAVYAKISELPAIVRRVLDEMKGE